MTGTTIAQAIPIAISPILTRMYTPEDFGMFALYMSVASILSVIATGRYELAIMLPKKDEDAINIVALSIVISFFVSFISFLIVFIFNAQITNLLGSPEISNWLYFIPITVLLTGVYQSFNYWSNRKKQYKRLAMSRVVQSGVAGSTNLGMGFAGFGSSGLILGGVLGQFISTTILGRLVWNEDKDRFVHIKRLKIIVLAKKYINFPKFDLMASFINIFSNQVIHILFTTVFNPIIAGFYYLTQRIIGLPISIVSKSIGDVFKEQASKDFKKMKNAKTIYISTFKKLFVLALLPSLLLYFFSVNIFI
ncbi:MAG: oligosaccharide flippase family protein, partial [Campylobacterota bacterium]|nr:oligosaccharide flippase family protein [Campylobacterota bacterium]